MGRSGTSAVTRALVQSGFFAGDQSELMQATRANPLGFYENLAVFRVNEGILDRSGGTWFMPPGAEAQLRASVWALPAVRSVVERLIDQANCAPVAVKDPRIGVLLDVWGPLIAETLHPVLVVRNPVEIARSLAVRDGTPIAFGLASWELHTLRLLEFLRGRRATVVPYKRLVSLPDAASEFVTDVTAELRRALRAAVDPAAAGAAIDQALHREQAESADAEEYLTSRQAELWRFLDGLEPGSQVLDVDLDVSPRTCVAQKLTRCELDRVRAEHDLGELRTQVASYESALAEAQRALVEAQRAMSDARERAIAAEHALRDLRSSTSWQLTAPLRALKRRFGLPSHR